MPYRTADKMAAHNAMMRALRSGWLVRPTRCDNCGTICKPAGHHHKGYAREHWLDVAWLCRPCHEDLHPHRPELGSTAERERLKDPAYFKARWAELIEPAETATS